MSGGISFSAARIGQTYTGGSGASREVRRLFDKRELATFCAPAYSRATCEETMNKATRFRLFLMMVLELYIWGCWLPLIYGYLPSLGFSAGERAWILNAFPIAAIIGSFSQQYADRISARTLMASATLWGLRSWVGFTKSFWIVCALMYVHCLATCRPVDTNSIACAHIKDPQRNTA